MGMLLITVGRLRDGGMAALERYGEAVIPLISAAGGEVVGRGCPQETVVGDDRRRPDLIALIRFPDAATIRQFLESAEYRAQVRHRDGAFVELHSYIAADLLEVHRART
jgi:uncharacterized protein (DUF1330 family)